MLMFLTSCSDNYRNDTMKETLGHSKSRGRLCITVLGASSVGKTALTVRYLTGRFIGDYCSGADTIYQHTCPYLGSWPMTMDIDILDVSTQVLYAIHEFVIDIVVILSYLQYILIFEIELIYIFLAICAVQ